jgi:transposase
MQTNFNSLILNIKDPNIHFSEKGPVEEEINNKRSLVFDATLAYKPSHCQKCGVVYNHGNIESKGYAHKLSLIKMPKVSRLNTYIRLRKQRHYCHECRSSFTCETSIVQHRCYISNNLKYEVADHAKMKISETDIAKLCNVSHSTVGRVIDSYHQPQKVYKHFLPEVLGMDEFKSTKKAAGAMSFIFTDLVKHEVIDIVEDRRLFSLLKYFNYFTYEARKMVKYIVIDMYTPYIQLIKKIFPNANIIIDRFHLVQLLGRSLQKTRIKIMKSFNKKTKEYRLLKKHFKLIGKARADVNDSEYRRWTRNGQMMTAIQVVDYILSLNDELNQSYQIYQSFILALKTNDVSQLTSILNPKEAIKSEYIQTSINSLKTFLPYIKNTIRTTYTNGFVEGFNNLIKVIKRIAFGYRSFYRFKNRIMIIAKHISIKKRYPAYS